MMTPTAARQNPPAISLEGGLEKAGELAVGSELMIAFALGAIGWYAIVRVIQWIAG